MKPSSFMIINVLDTNSYIDCHIPGSINIPLDELKGYAQSHLERDTRLILYCAHYQCAASKKAADLLSQMGFKNIQLYEGGMAEWYQMGFARAGVCNAQYLTTAHEPVVPTNNEYDTITTLELKKLIDEQ